MVIRMDVWLQMYTCTTEPLSQQYQAFGLLFHELGSVHSIWLLMHDHSTESLKKCVNRIAKVILEASTPFVNILFCVVKMFQKGHFC